MELFTGGREPFSQHVAPFPELTAMIESAENSILGDHRLNLPPQKLRPIRYNGKSPASSQAEDHSEFTDVVELMGDEVCPLNGDSRGDLFETGTPIPIPIPIKPEIGDGGNGNGPTNLEQGDHSPSTSTSGSSSSNSEETDISATMNKPFSRKRKLETRNKIELFMEKMVMKVMKRQEEMHKQLIGMIERRERERITREEAWKRQEMERIKMDQEARSQEISRSIALISFIQNVLGHEVEIPIQSTVSCMEESRGRETSEDHMQKDMISPCEPNRWQEGTMKASEDHMQKDMINPCEPNRWQEGTMKANGGEGIGMNSDPNNRRWPDTEVQSLIMLRSSLEHKFRLTGSKCSIWDDISVGMSNMGYSRSAKKCKEKWENINKYFRKSVGSGKKHVENSKRCSYFQDLDMLYKNGLVSPTNHVNWTKDETEGVNIGSDCQ